MLILEMGQEYAGRTYSIITRNCNHFTDDLAKRLCSQGIPGWINRMAYVGKAFEWLQFPFPLTNNNIIDIFCFLCLDRLILFLPSASGGFRPSPGGSG